MSGSVDHLVVGSADLDTGVRWVEQRLGVSPVFGGVHDGVGTRNALLGLGEQYLEVLALDPSQPDVTGMPEVSGMIDQLRGMTSPTLITVVVAKAPLANPVSMSRVGPGGLRTEWEMEFTDTPLYFIDWKQTPRPAGLPDGGRITSLEVTTPQPHMLAEVDGISVREGAWHIEATVNGTPLA